MSSFSRRRVSRVIRSAVAGSSVLTWQNTRIEIPEWLEQFVISSQTMIKNGDPDAVALAADYNGS